MSRPAPWRLTRAARMIRYIFRSTASRRSYANRCWRRAHTVLGDPDMADNENSLVPRPSPEHRRVAAGQFERANQVIASGNFDYGIQLLVTCCKLDPANLIYRQALRKTEKKKFNNNLRGSRLAFVTTSAAKTKLKAARASDR